MNVLLIERERLKLMKPSYNNMSLLDFMAVDNKDGTVEIIKNRYNHIKGNISKSMFDYFVSESERLRRNMPD